MRHASLSIAFIALIMACSGTSGDPATVRAHGPFACVHEADHLPAIDPRADAVYRYGLHLEQELGSPVDDIERPAFDRIARYYRVAAAHGDHRAGMALIDLMVRVRDIDPDNMATPWRTSREAETRQLLARMAADKVPAAIARQGGFAEQDWALKTAVVLYRHAAELGHAHAQYRLAQLLDPDTGIGATAKASRADAKVAAELYRCAAEQGYREAFHAVGRLSGRSDDVLAIYQRGMAAGDPASAQAMKEHLSKASNRTADSAERLRRYEAIRIFLIDHQHEDVRMPDIDAIVPRPPAVLPPWDGAFQWAADRARAKAAAKVPDKPEEAQMHRLCKDKGLDVASGSKLP